MAPVDYYAHTLGSCVQISKKKGTEFNGLLFITNLCKPEIDYRLLGSADYSYV